MPDPGKKGVKTKLLGVVLVILGAMDCMLSWRGGVAPSQLYVLMLAAGIFLYLIGAVRQGSST